MGAREPSEVNWLAHSRDSAASLVSSGFADSLAKCNNVPGTDMAVEPPAERPSGLPAGSEALDSDLGSKALTEEPSGSPEVRSSVDISLFRERRQLNSRLLRQVTTIGADAAGHGVSTT